MKIDFGFCLALGLVAAAFEAPAQQPGAKLWAFPAGQKIQSSPVIGSNGAIYFGADNGKLFALDPKGKLLWEFLTGGNVIAAPAIGADGAIYFGSLDRYFYALNPDGTQRWKFFAAGGMVSSPALGPDGTIYVGTVFNRVLAISPDGKQRWEFQTGKNLVSSPAVGLDGTIYIGCLNDRLYAIGPDGSKKWEFTAGGPISSSPAIGGDGTIYFGSQDMSLYALNPSGIKKWAFPTSGAIRCSPVIGPDGTLYVGSDDRKLYAVGADGSRKWTFAAGYWIHGSAAVADDGTIYFGAFDNKFYAINRDGTKQWEFETGFYIASSPTIGDDGTVYFGSFDNNFYALKGSAPLAKGIWPKFHGNFSQTGGVLPPGMPSKSAAFVPPATPPQAPPKAVEIPLPTKPVLGDEAPAPAMSPLAVRVNGEGKVTGAVDGQLLDNGKRYYLVAEPAPGYVFNSWSGSVPTNSPRVTFIMRSNLTFQANFSAMTQNDRIKPTIEITTPAEGVRLPNPIFTVRGLAHDNVAVARVEYQVGTNDFQTAGGTNEWFVRLTAQPGLNTIRVKAIDLEGNESPVISRSFNYVVMSPLTLQISGLGAVTPPLVGRLLEIGRSYTLTAEPARDYVFGGWGGGVQSDTPKLSFVMQSNLVLEAHFISKPYSQARGVYNGLVFATSHLSPDTTGQFTLSVNETGSFTGRLGLGEESHSFSGQLDGNGNTETTVRSGKVPLKLIVHVDTDKGTDQVTGSLSSESINAELLGDRQVFDGRTRKFPRAGRFTFILPGGTNALASPVGDGFGSLTVDSSGSARITAELADGTAISDDVFLSKDGVCPFHLSLYGGAGMIHGWLTVNSLPASDVSGKLTWIKPPGLPKEKYYPDGFTATISVLGSAYQEPHVAESGGLVGLLRGGNLDEIVIKNVGPSGGKSDVDAENQFRWSFSPSTGFLTGSFLHPITQKITQFKGVFLPKQNWRSGYFLGPDQSGFVYLGTPQ